MPPKRKYKATKVKATPSVASSEGMYPSFPQRSLSGGRNSTVANSCPLAAGGIRTSSIKRRNSSQAAKPSRLQPSEPLHMTTRAASKAASNTASPVAAPSSSVADPGSRRSSLNSVVQVDAPESDAENVERPVKRSRLSTDSGSPPAAEHPFNHAQPAPAAAQVNDDAQPPVAVQQIQHGQQPPASPVTPASPAFPRTAGKKRRSSSSSAELPPNQVSQASDPQPNGIATKSPSDGSASEQQPRKRRKVVVDDAPDSSADHPPEMTDSSTPPGSPENVPEVEINAGLPIPAANGDAPTKVAKRLPGRRRQPHPDINIETDLRRQLHLKMGYRSIAKALKPILAELGERTVHNLENDPEFHKQFPEYDEVIAQLESVRDEKLHRLRREKEIKDAQLDRVKVATEHIWTTQFQVSLIDMSVLGRFCTNRS